MIDLRKQDLSGASMMIREAVSLTPFTYGLEYSAPARGCWTIVHIGMLLPESHQVYICAKSCLRGVFLSAAELNASNRFSTIAVDEANVIDGNCEEMIINGVSNILENCSIRPRVILIFTSCIHHFLGSDLPLVYDTLRKKYPDVGFVDCYMNPIMRKTKLPPDPFIRKQLYFMLQPTPKKRKAVNFIGNNIAIDAPSELLDMLNLGGYEIMDICTCQSYTEYEKMAESCLNITTNPLGNPAATELKKRLGQKHLYLPVSYDFDEIESNLHTLADTLNIPIPNIRSLRLHAIDCLKNAAYMLQDYKIAIDYTASSRPLGMAKLLLRFGFRVTTVYGDTFSDEEKDTFRWLQDNAGDMELNGTVYHKMAVLPRTAAENFGGKLLAIGQKAAYFTGTTHFVNIVEDGGLYGFSGICRLTKLMLEAAAEKKDAEKIIQIKGLGCCC